MKSIRRKGFTLVELLIVIVVIGILSAMMMLSSTEAVSSARASNVVSNLRNIKTAVLSWYADNLNRVVKDGSEYKIYTKDSTTEKNILITFVKDKGGESELLAYLSNGSSISFKDKSSAAVGEYILTEQDNSSGGRSWYVGLRVGTDKNLQSKVASKASSVGLTGGGKTDVTNTYTGGEYVYMLIHSL